MATLRNDDGTIRRVHRYMGRVAGGRGTLDFAEVDGRIECVRFEIGARFDLPNEPDPKPLSTSVLRKVKLGDLIEKGRKAYLQNFHVIEREATAEIRRKLRQRLPAAKASGGRMGPGGRRVDHGPEHFAEVAAVYAQALRVGDKPTQAVAKKWNVSKTTAAHWVSRARNEMKLLPKTGRGKAAGPSVRKRGRKR